MNKVLVTGATGFIGQHLLHYLQRRKCPLRALVRKEQSFNFTNLAIDNNHSQKIIPIETFVADIATAESLSGACNGIDTVFHLAGLAHAQQQANDALKHHQVNFLGTKHLFTEAKRAGVKCFIYFSSVKAFDAEKRRDESPYAKAKYQAEQFLLANREDMHVSILRPALVYGVGCKGNLAAMLSAIDRQRFPPLPEVHNRRSMVSAYDLCHAAVLASLKPIANGKIYTVTDGIDYSSRQLYEWMAEALGKKPAKFSIPFPLFRALATVGDLIYKITKKPMPFTTDTLSKLFGSAEYSAHTLQKELGFIAIDHFEKVLPAMVADYRKKMMS